MNIDEMIAKALKEEFEEEMKQYSADTAKHRFSLSYRLWERKTLRDLDRGRFSSRWTLKKARAAVAFLTAAALVLFGGTVYAAVSMGRYVLNNKSEYSELFIENLSSDKTSIEEYYGLPEKDGWTVVQREELNGSAIIKYSRGQEALIFSQSVIDGSIGNINTENAVIEPASVYEENDGLFITFQKENGCALYWIYDGYLFKVIGDFNKNQAINIAYSTKIIDE